MKTRYLCFLMIFCVTSAYGDNMIINKTNITIDDIKSFLFCRESVLRNIKFIYTLRSEQPRYPEYNYKTIIVFGRAGNKVGVEKIFKEDVSNGIFRSMYFFDGEKGYYWAPKTNSITMFGFKPFAESRIGEYLLPFTDWSIGLPLTKTLEDDDDPEIVESYMKDNEQYVVFKTNVHSYVKEDLKYIDKSKWATLDQNKIVFKCVYDVNKNIITHRELYINEPCHIVLDVDETKEISPGVHFPIKVSSKSFEKNPDGNGFRVRGYGTTVFRNVILCKEEDSVDAISFELPRGAEVYNNHTREISISGESRIRELPQEEIDTLSVARRLFGLSYQDLVNMLGEIE